MKAPQIQKRSNRKIPYLCDSPSHHSRIFFACGTGYRYDAPHRTGRHGLGPAAAAARNYTRNSAMYGIFLYNGTGHVIETNRQIVVQQGAQADAVAAKNTLEAAPVDC